MKDLLTNYYAIQVKKEIKINGKTGFKSNEYVYFTIPIENKEAILMEQTALAYHLFEMGYQTIALPIQNINGEWLTNYNENNYSIVQVKELQMEPLKSHGSLLANFHRLLTTYKYEPQSISSYGQWKSLWINKLVVFENKIIEESEKHPNSYYRLVMDVLPYIIGISENAIQYIQESEREKRYGNSDQGTIAFWRYNDHLLEQVIWPYDLVYDHLTRDIAEYIRNRFMRNDEQWLEDVTLFIQEYELVQQLSPFSWRLLYGRLLFPVQIFDLLESGFQTTYFKSHYDQLCILIEKQVLYEQKLKRLFEIIEQNDKSLRIPMVQWL